MTSLSMDGSTSFSSSEALVKHTVKAKYIPLPEGGERLAMIERSGLPIFSPEGWEKVEDSRLTVSTSAAPSSPEENEKRALRRAKQAAFDLILCNHGLDTFATLTYDPGQVSDTSDFGKIYRPLRGWLSNAVQRHGLQYVMVAERHKKGGIHLHALMNSAALRMEKAVNPHTGGEIKRHGRLIYNITSWPYGFSTAERMGRQNGDREAVAKYIFKYMGKIYEAGNLAKIGGRYFYHGGDLRRPRYSYGDEASGFADLAEASGHFSCEVGGGIEYERWTFI